MFLYNLTLNLQAIEKDPSFVLLPSKEEAYSSVKSELVHTSHIFLKLTNFVYPSILSFFYLLTLHSTFIPCPPNYFWIISAEVSVIRPEDEVFSLIFKHVWNHVVISRGRRKWKYFNFNWIPVASSSLTLTGEILWLCPTLRRSIVLFVAFIYLNILLYLRKAIFFSSSSKLSVTFPLHHLQWCRRWSCFSLRLKTFPISSFFLSN